MENKKLPEIVDVSNSQENAYELPRLLKYIKEGKFTLYFDNNIQLTITTNSKKNIEDLKKLNFNIYAPLQPRYTKETLKAIPTNVYSRKYDVSISQKNYSMTVCGVILVNPYHMYQKKRLHTLNIAKNLSDVPVNYLREKFLIPPTEEEKKEEELKELILRKKYEEDKDKGIIDLTPFFDDYQNDEKFLVTYKDKLNQIIKFYLTTNFDENKSIINNFKIEEPLPSNSIDWKNIPKTVFSPDNETYILPHFPVVYLFGISIINGLYSEKSEAEFYDRMDLAHKPKPDNVNPDDYPRVVFRTLTGSSNKISDYTYNNSNRLTKKVYKQVLANHYGVVVPQPVKKRKRAKKLEVTLPKENESK